MIKEFKCYTLLCDNCGADLNDCNVYSGFEDIKHSIEVAKESDWIEQKGKWYCDNCYEFNGDSGLMINKTRTKEVKND